MAKLMTMSPPAIIEQDQSLVRLEAVIERGKKAFVEVGKALAEIQVRGLYKRTHATFEAYCQDRWGFQRRTAYNYIQATEVVDNVHSNAQSPPSLRQAVVMAVLTPEQQQSVASRVNFQTTTVSELKKEIDRERGKPSGIKHAKPDQPALVMSQRLLAAQEHAWTLENALADTQKHLELALRPKVHDIRALDSQQLAEKIVKLGYAALITGNHPDTGGNHKAAALLNNAQTQLRQFIRGDDFENEE